MSVDVFCVHNPFLESPSSGNQYYVRSVQSISFSLIVVFPQKNAVPFFGFMQPAVFIGGENDSYHVLHVMSPDKV